MKKCRRILAMLLCVAMLGELDGVTLQAAGVIDVQDAAATETEKVTETQNGIKTESLWSDTEVATEQEAAEKIEAATETEQEATEKIEAATETEQEATEKAEAATEQEETEKIEAAAETEREAAEKVEAATEQEAAEKVEAATEQDATEKIEVAATEITQEPQMLLSYLAVGNSYVETPGEQYVLAGIDAGEEAVETAKLHYKNDTTGAEYTVTADTIEKDLLLFYMNFADTSFTGSYRIMAIDYTTKSGESTVSIPDTGIDARFGVNCQVDTDPDTQIIDPDTQDAGSVVITDAAGQQMSASEFGTAVENAAAGTAATTGVDATGSGTLNVVLDPGHGGTDGGASYFGYKESDLALQIATYCKAELDTYDGIKTYMTRTTDQTMGATQVESLDNRVAIAAKYGADVLVSFHLNASTNSTANGVSVYYPNSNYNPTVGNTGNGLAAKIQAKLVALGLKDNGTKIWNASETTYPDGSLADYLGLIRRAKNAGFPCVLIEHAFLSNSGDVSNYLNSADKLKKVGVADAAGIAQYYGLKKKTAKVSWDSITSKSSTELDLSWKKISGASGYYLYRSTDEKSGYKKIATLKKAAATTYTDTGLKAGTKYYYKIKYYNADGTSKNSDVMCAYPMKKTSITSVVSDGSGKLKISWKKGSGASGYRLYRSTSKKGTYTKIATISSGTDLTYTDSGLTSGKTYYYKIKSYRKQNGKTGYSSSSSVVDGWSVKKTSITGVKSTVKGSLTIEWKKVSGAYRYQVYQSTAKNGKYTRLATVKGTSYSDTSVKADKTYYYKIRVVNRVDNINGYSSYSAVWSGKQVGKPVISEIRSKSSSSLLVIWKSVSGANGYKVYRSESKNGKYVQIAKVSGKVTEYTDGSRKSGKTYYYKVQALNKVNGYSGCGKYSSVASAQTMKKTAISYVQSVNSKKLKLEWSKVSGATGYQIYRSTSEKGTYTRLAEVNAKTTTYTDKTVKAAKKYYYKVRAIRKKSGKTGYGSFSAILGGKTVKTTKINKIYAVSKASVTIEWTKVSGASGYQIYRATAKNGSYSRIKTISSANTTTYTDVPPKTNKTYYYKVRCYNKNNGKQGYSEGSAPVSGKSIASANLSLQLTSAGAIRLSWKTVGGAVSYRIYKKAANGGGWSKLADVAETKTSYTDKDVRSGIAYSYQIRAYNRVNGIKGSSDSSTKSYTIAYYEIMGKTTATVAQMVKCYQASGHAYPGNVYSAKGAGDIATFATILCQEAAAEGVRAEVLWAQVILETGWLQFTGSMVRQDQCNFGGLGAVDNSGGSFVATFADVRTGLRAQAQHLKAYATTAALSQECVDPRFHLVTRGVAVYVEWLGQKENPTGRGWATGENYGYNIMRLVNQTKSY